jgi:hypothetical protein
MASAAVLVRGLAARRLPQIMWYGVALVHAPGVVAATKLIVLEGVTVDRLCRFAALLASILFFVLKGQDVAILRWKNDWRSYLCLGLAVIVVHLGFLEKSISNGNTTQNHPLAAFALVLGPHRLISTLQKRWQNRACLGIVPCRAEVCGHVGNQVPIAFLLLLLSPAFLPRPPPSLLCRDR